MSNNLRFPQIMGILNITPNSFSDGGIFFDAEEALLRAQKMIEEGASIIDVGAESTAPGNTPISADTEWDRLSSLFPNLVELPVLLSLDSYKSAVWERAVQYKPNLIFNDVSGLQKDQQEKLRLLKTYTKTKVIVMYSRNPSLPDSVDIMKEISFFFEEVLQVLLDHGIEKERIILDPGMGGFLSKTPEVSFQVLGKLGQLQKFGCKILVGTSRKSFLKTVSDPINSHYRMVASVVTALQAWENGADILRVHDVHETQEGIKTQNMIHTHKE